MGISRDTTVRQVAGLSHGHRLRTPEAAKYLGVGESTLEKWRCSGCGPEFERAGSRIVVYSISSLEAFLAARRASSTSERSQDLSGAPTERPRQAIAQLPVSPKSAAAPLPSPKKGRRSRHPDASTRAAR
jgi:predicted DNA-binding transcriptional regulator AlpA